MASMAQHRPDEKTMDPWVEEKPWNFEKEKVVTRCNKAEETGRKLG
jgi:hypothetical protein